MYAGKTPQSVSQRGVRLSAVLVSAESNSVQCKSILDFRKFYFLSLRSVSLRRVTFFTNISPQQLIFQQHAILACLSGAQVQVRFIGGKYAIESRDTATLSKGIPGVQRAHLRRCSISAAIEFVLWRCCIQHRRTIELEEKAKVFAFVWGTEFVQFLAAIAVLPWSKR